MWQDIARAKGLEQHHQQVVLIWTANWDEVSGKLQRYQFDFYKKRWLKIGCPIPIVVGKNGMALKKQEGDGRTPAGIFEMGSVFGFDKINKLKMPFILLNNHTVCIDDANSYFYNQLLDSSKVTAPDWLSSEQMRKVKEYRLGSVIQYNIKRERGKGSCIFLHIWTSPHQGTNGCIAMQENQLKKLLLWLDAEKKPVIVVLPAYPSLRKLLTKQFPLFPVPF